VATYKLSLSRQFRSCRTCMEESKAPEPKAEPKAQPMKEEPKAEPIKASNIVDLVWGELVGAIPDLRDLTPEQFRAVPEDMVREMAGPLSFKLKAKLFGFHKNTVSK